MSNEVLNLDGVNNFIEYHWGYSYFDNGNLITTTGSIETDFISSIDKDNIKSIYVDTNNKIIGFFNNKNFIYMFLENINLLNQLTDYLMVLVKEVKYVTIPIDKDVDPYTSIRLFNLANGLSRQEFNLKVEILNIIEEVYEMTGLESSEARKKAEEFVNTLDFTNAHKGVELIDDFADINIFSTGAIDKLKYNPKEVLVEAAKEINSRKGKIVDGKFIKCKTEDCKKEWYKADYSKCERL